uniref:Phenylalanyl tRNA synthetase beta chain core domain-containing protein n=1 Tax=Ananas comosus var. bracteatus TaxID=296719 RepID=A0A6V7Q3B4_ANACO|nr:unnamed protein product [Ananas comosus var. bracteatus]
MVNGVHVDYQKSLRRTLVAIGTHDLDALQGPFSYEAKSFRADELLEFYKSDMKLKKFLHIIENSPVYPVIYDNNRAGYLELLTWILCSHEENFSMLKREDDGKKAVIIANPRSSEFEVVRTSLMSCLLKTLKHNIDHPRPLTIFEVGDVVTLDAAHDVGAANNRRLAALYCNVTSVFEEILLVERIMKIVRAPYVQVGDSFTRP